MPAAFDIAEILGPATPHIRVCAVGAMYVREGYEPHDALIAKGLCTVVGFEPIANECERLNQVRGPAHRYLPHVIGDGSQREFHITNHTMTSSIYAPNTELLRKFHQLDEFTRPVTREPVQTRRLDELSEIGDVDFLKIDAQGATADVLAGAAGVLRGTVVVHAEVEFVPLYQGEKLFGEVDTQMRGHGFAFHRFGEVSGRSFRPLFPGNDPFGSMGQLLWADVVYARDFMTLQTLAPAKLRALATILHEVYQSYDLCAYALQVHDSVAQSDYQPRYIQRLVRAAPAAPARAF
jgi:FkbM family methyltransferase